MRARLLMGAGVLALALSGCDTSEGDAPLGKDGGGSDTSGGGGSDAVTDSATSGDGSGGPSVAPLSSFPNACTDAKPCASAEQICSTVTGEDAGICITKPKAEATITDPVAEDNTDQKPNLDCVDAALPAATGKKVRLHGFVDRFGSGGITTGITVRVYDAAKFNPGRCDGLAAAEAFACHEEVIGDTSAILGEAISTEVPDQSAEGKDCEEGANDCPLGFECNDATGFPQCHEQFGLFEIAGIPTNTPVVVMTAPPEDEADVWHRTFLYGVAFLDDFAKGDDYRYDPTIVGDGQWKTVPNPFNTAIAPGNGAIGGRIRDCSKGGADKRSSWHIYEATVGFAKAPSITGYFNEFESDTLPVPSRTTTNILGRYVGLDVEPGSNWVTGSVMVDGKAVSLGAYPVYVFPSSLAVVSFPGIVPPSTAE